MDTHVHPDESLNPHARGHQEDRVNVGAIGIFAVGLVTVVVIIFLVLAVMMSRFSQEQQRLDERRPALFALEDSDLYPGPRLQEAPGRDVSRMRIEVNQRLSSYGWVNRKAGVAHIPIERAMAITAEQGLPSRSDTPGDPSE